jgi:hypothetical protein
MFAGARACVALAAAAAGTAAADNPPALHVSGKWTITVRHHGVVSRRVRFENSLSAGGTQIGQVLAGQVTPGQWKIVSPPLGLSMPATVALADGAVVLTGDHTFQTAQTLGELGTELWTCASSVAPSDCQGSRYTGGAFTYRTGVHIPVAEGDAVHFVVKLSVSVPAAVGYTSASALLASLLAGKVTAGPWLLDVTGDEHDWNELATTASWSTSEFTLKTSVVSAETRDNPVTGLIARLYECGASVAPSSCTSGQASPQFPVGVFHHVFASGPDKPVVTAGQQANILWAVKFS